MGKTQENWVFVEQLTKWLKTLNAKESEDKREF